MTPLSILIKPASSQCNLRCRYCFYADETQNRAVRSFGMMSEQTAERLIQGALAKNSPVCFAFQGGEPTLIGLDFYRFFVRCAAENNPRHLPIDYAIQTNGSLIDAEWAGFLAKNRFLVGLSLDGTKEVNDRYRVDAAGKGSYARIMHAAQLLTAGGVDFNILTTVTADCAKNIGSIYGFFKRSGFGYQQYIACLDPIGQRGGMPYSLTAEAYGEFLKRLFDLWYADWKKGRYISIRYFDNLIHMLCGMPPEACGMSGCCSVQYVVEADGGVYPCDFYVLDEYLLGNVNTSSFDDIDARRLEIGFIESSRRVDPECQKCSYYRLCRGGCRRDRDGFDGGAPGRSVFCGAYKAFFDDALPRMLEVAAEVKGMRR